MMMKRCHCGRLKGETCVNTQNPGLTHSGCCSTTHTYPCIGFTFTSNQTKIRNRATWGVCYSALFGCPSTRSSRVVCVCKSCFSASKTTSTKEVDTKLRPSCTTEGPVWEGENGNSRDGQGQALMARLRAVYTKTKTLKSQQTN